MTRPHGSPGDDDRDGPSGACSSIRVGRHVWRIYQSVAPVKGAPRQLALLIHGVGASMHSFQGLAAALQNEYDILAIDLPGHAGTRSPRWDTPTLDGVSTEIADLLRALAATPDLAIGHSAGAAILCRMCLRGLIAPDAIVSINGALSPFAGAAGFIFPLMAKALHYNPIVAPFAAASARDRKRVQRLIAETGSAPPASYVDGYWRLIQEPRHIAGALAMMAHWDLAELARSIRALQPRALFIVGAKDRAVPPSIGRKAADISPSGELTVFENLGHLAHEEDPQAIARRILAFAATL